METKSRYEVISELEQKRRTLIQERDGLNDVLINKQAELKKMSRQKSDTVLIMDRQIEDKQEEITHFEKTLKERRETIIELINSVNESLKRFESSKN